MKDISANRKPLQGVRGFLTVSVIGFVLTLALLVDETESAREAKGTKSVKSNKEKVRKISYISVFVKALVLVKFKLLGWMLLFSQSRELCTDTPCRLMS